MKKLTAILFFITAAVNCYPQAGQVLWFASPSGNDVTGNGTLGNPYQTITKAAQQLDAGDTLYIRGGIYTNATFGANNPWRQETTARISNRNGTAANRIVVMPYNNEQPVIKSDGQFGFQINGSSYIKVQGLELFGEGGNITMDSALKYQFAFRRNVNLPDAYPGLGYENRLPPGTNTDQAGLEDLSALVIFRPFYYFTHGLVVQNSHHIDVVNNKAHHFPGEGIRFAGCDYINATANTIYENSHKSSNGGHGMSCYTLNSIDANTGVKILMAGNLCYSNYCEVASWSELKTIFTATIDEGKGLTIQRSTASGNWDAGRIRFENNICYDNGLSGIHVNEGDRIDIVNNTLYLNNHTGSGNNLGISVDGNDIRVYNNIVQSNLSWGGFTISATAATSNLVVSNNLVNGNLDNDVNAVDVNTLFGTAQFANAASGNFRLTAASPAINNALAAVAPTNDFDLLTRDIQPDRGAFEYFAALPLNWLSFTATAQDVQVLLQWNTSAERNTAYFEIYQSGDGADWQPAGRVTAMPNGSGNHYSFTDISPYKGKNYYKIKQVDMDGRFSWSHITTVTFVPVPRVELYPNPFSNVIFITGFTNTANTSVRMFDAGGRDVTPRIGIKRTEAEITLETIRLKPGGYIVSVNKQSFFITKTK